MKASIHRLFLVSALVAAGCAGLKLNPAGQDQTTPENIASPTVTATQLAASPRAPSRPLPAFIREVSPPPDESIPLSTFENLDHEKYLGVGLPGRGSGYDSTVCARIDVEPLLQPGDDLSEWETVLERMTMEVDGTTLDDVALYMQVDTLGYRTDGKGTPWATYSGPYGFCWHADLGPGTHQARVTFRASNGFYPYQWYFTLTEQEP